MPSRIGIKGETRLADQLRIPFFIAALVLAVMIVAIELGGGLLISAPAIGNVCSQLPDDDDIRDECDPDEIDGLAEDVPGLALSAMALVDGILLFTMGLMALPLLIPDSLHGRIQGIVTLIFALLMLIGAIGVGFFAFGKLLVMLGLLFSFPFGTIAYFAIYAFFARGAASAVLSGVMLFKIGFVVCLLLAQQRFLQNKGLVIMIITALLINVIVSFLHGFVPLFLVSITDAIGAIVMAICSGIWAIVLLVGALIAIVKAVT